MSPQEKFQRFVAQYPHPRRPFYARQHVTRRQLFHIFGAGVTATCMIGKPAPAGVVVLAFAGIVMTAGFTWFEAKLVPWTKD